MILILFEYLGSALLTRFPSLSSNLNSNGLSEIILVMVSAACKIGFELRYPTNGT